MDMTVRNFGRQFAWGVFDVLAIIIVAGLILSFALQAILPTDDCDRGRFDRCGMRVLTDEKTGVEYLVTSKGGIIERAITNQ